MVRPQITGPRIAKVHRGQMYLGNLLIQGGYYKAEAGPDETVILTFIGYQKPDSLESEDLP